MKFPMLEISWNEIRHAFGPATDVPHALEELISEDPAVRRKAYFQLDNYVVVQSDLYEAAFYCIPTLLQFVKEWKYDEIYDLIFEIANGTARPDQKINLDMADVPLERACKDALHAGAPVFAKDALNAELSNRMTPVDILHSIGLLADDAYEEIYVELKNGFSTELPERSRATLQAIASRA